MGTGTETGTWGGNSVLGGDGTDGKERRGGVREWGEEGNDGRGRRGSGE